MKIVLNVILAKQKGMGGFNVAVNFFNKTFDDRENEWYYFVSTVFDEEVKGFERGLDSDHYYVFHPQPNARYFFKDGKRIRQIEDKIQPDVIYSILAPSYHRFKTVEVMRCANAWTVKGGVNKYAWKVTPLKYKIRYFIKARTTHLLMRRTKYFITQSNIAKQCILKTVRTSSDNVCVVSNVLSERLQKINTVKTPHTEYNMVYASSPAVHKDYLILPQVASILINKYGIKGFKIHVTIPESIGEVFLKKIKQYNIEEYFVNHGFMNHDDLIKVYLLCDLGLFPSLLETFSGTLLEYMYFKLPIIASDLDFNREVAENAAQYFEAHNAEDLAAKIYEVYSNDDIKQSLLENAQMRLTFYSNNNNKYSETIGFLKWVVQHLKTAKDI